MKKTLNFIVAASIMLFFTSCGGDSSNKEEKMTADEAYEKLTQIEEEVLGPNNAVSQSKLMELMTEAQNFHKNYYDDKRVPSALQKGIRAAVSLKQYNKAIDMIDVLIKDYATDKTAPEYLFQKAFIYGESGWFGEADKLYEQVISNYPKHPLAEQAKAAREMLTMSDEEIIKKLENAQPVQ
ncbi:MAG: tetratricopeptide repeat protein [Bacteroidia bacterium]